MNIGRLARACVLLCCAGLVTTIPATSATQSATVPSFAHVVVVVMENTNAYSTNNFAITHPSLPNYLALTGASTFGITSDCSPSVCPVNATNLMDRVEGAGLSWKAYMET